MQVLFMLERFGTFEFGSSQRRAASRGPCACPEERRPNHVELDEGTVYSAAVALAGLEYTYQSERQKRPGSRGLYASVFHGRPGASDMMT